MFSKKTTVAYAVEECDSCDRSSKRAYKSGDVLFEPAGQCSCGGGMRVAKIYGQAVEK